jgi:circadian clock protein KaiB
MKSRPRLLRKSSPPPPSFTPNGPWHFRLYVAGQTPRSLTAIVNLRQLCETYLAGRHRIEVIDLAKSPELGRSDQIIALPTLVRKQPAPAKRLIGDLSNIERVLVSIDLMPNRTIP